MIANKETFLAILGRQWRHRNHEIFGNLAKRQIKRAIRGLRAAKETA